MTRAYEIIEKIKSENFDSLSKEDLLTKFESILLEKEREEYYLQKQFNELKVIIDMVPNTISWINSDLTYLNVNQALAKTCKLRTEEFIGKPIGFHTKEKFFYEFAVELFRSSQPSIYQEIEAKISGNDKVFLMSGTKINNDEQAVVIGVDITEIKNLKGHISLTEKLATLGEMFAGIIHDINNPLMMIDASAFKIAKLTDNEEIHDILGKIRVSSNRINKIIKGVKVFVHQEKEAPYQSESIGEIIEESILICENKLKVGSINLTFDYNLKSKKINCNYTQIFQVFVNLISNAIDAIEKLDNKWIEITLDREDKDFYYIQFKDSGTGIPEEVAKNIFNAFYTTKPRGIGSGLGLSLVSKILEAHHGQIYLLNDKPNTTFEIKLAKN